MKGRVVLRSDNHCFACDSHCFARVVLRIYLLRNFGCICFSVRSIKAHERSKLSCLTYLSDQSSHISPSHCPISGVREEVKKISNMNIDLFKAVGNGSVASSSGSSSPRPYLANGGNLDKSYHSLSNEFSFPSGGISLPHLHAVVVLNFFFWVIFL
ncbi:hypothetical protein TEA_014243 [Camellia sinensis var. sinensis]|uniref:Uncharacterized protein n=1 Tax=Camellia sinensis var. sinensis TaxID=542762 RepID=A0A4V3WNQ0_CAMSN|nr:hypothetical protein TEA_014243 [Camellia sinensis var. sinensis]